MDKFTDRAGAVADTAANLLTASTGNAKRGVGGRARIVAGDTI